jgi:hypothetical protein
MGGGFIGGDSSVQWEIFGNDVCNNHDSQPHGASGRKHRGVDQTPDRTENYFEVLLKGPVKDLGVKNGYRRFTLKIERDTPRQIVIRWPSRSPNPKKINALFKKT